VRLLGLGWRANGRLVHQFWPRALLARRRLGKSHGVCEGGPGGFH